MRYLTRIGGMLLAIILASAVAATFLGPLTAQVAGLGGIDSVGLFVVLTTMGMVSAIMTREAWLVA